MQNDTQTKMRDNIYTSHVPLNTKNGTSKYMQILNVLPNTVNLHKHSILDGSYAY